MDIEFDKTQLEEELKKLDEKIKYAEENYGDTEVRDAIMEKGDLYLKHNDIENAKKTYL